ncbi:sce7726 family protein [Luteimonas notoginsengisoli]|uniref:Sce7726 family protein n=1 Tax=Luteimonas notoginsengisoli TaxID=1578200 RepID=A0ABV7UTF2_9GAMM
MEEASSSELWGIFKPSVVRELSRAEGGGETRSYLKRLLLQHGGPKSARVSDVYETAFAHLSRNQPAEYFYKNAVLQRNVLSRYGSKRSRVFFEFRAGTSKLDALIARDSMHAYEIKTERDHFRRLPTQISDYQQRFAHVWILSSEKQAARLEGQVSSAVGLAYMSSRRTFEIVREASRNTAGLRAAAILECLRRNEYLKVLEEFGFSGLGLPNTAVFREAMKFSSTLDPEQVHEATLERLKDRPNALSVSALAKLPLYIRAAAVAARCDDEDVQVLLKNLACKVYQKERA